MESNILHAYVSHLREVCLLKQQGVGDSHAEVSERFSTLVTWWDANSPLVSVVEREIGNVLQAYAKQQAAVYRIASNKAAQQLRSFVCFSLFVVLLLGVSFFLGFYAYGYDQGVEVYSLINAAEPQQLCFCDTRCQCTCSDLNVIDTDLDRLMECHLAVEAVFLPFAGSADDSGLREAARNGSLATEFFNTSCRPFVDRIDEECNTTVQYFGNRLAGLYAGPWSSNSVEDWSRVNAFLYLCFSSFMWGNISQSLCTRPELFPEQIEGSIPSMAELFEAGADPTVMGCSYACALADQIPGIIFEKFRSCNSPRAMSPVEGRWTTSEALWWYYRWIRTDDPPEFKFFRDGQRGDIEELFTYVQGLPAERQLLKERNLCPANGGRMGYLLTVTVTCTVVVVLWGLSYKYVAVVLRRNALPGHGAQHYGIMTKLGQTLLFTASDCLADWATWFIDVRKRVYSRPSIFYSFGIITAVNTVAHIAHLSLLYRRLMQSGVWSADWPKEDRPLQGIMVLLLAVDGVQALLLVGLVSREEIEEAGMSYLLLVWTLFNYVSASVPLTENFILKGRDSHVGRAAQRVIDPLSAPVNPPQPPPVVGPNVTSDAKQPTPKQHNQRQHETTGGTAAQPAPPQHGRHRNTAPGTTTTQPAPAQCNGHRNSTANSKPPGVPAGAPLPKAPVATHSLQHLHPKPTANPNPYPDPEPYSMPNQHPKIDL